VGQGGASHRPPLTFDPNELLGGDKDFGQEHFVEFRITGHLDERADINSFSSHVNDEGRDALLRAGRIGVGAGQAQAERGELRVRGPDLSTGDQITTVDGDGAGRERGQITAGVGLAEELAPDLVGREDGREEALALVVRAMGQQGRPDQVDADAVDRLRRL
jgi:hypothetical protein